MRKLICCLMFAVAATMLSAAEAPSPEAMMNEEAYAAAKEAMLRRPRRVMHNNDGCDVTHYPVDKLPVTVEKFLAQRITCTAGIVVKFYPSLYHLLTS